MGGDSSTPHAALQAGTVAVSAICVRGSQHLGECGKGGTQAEACIKSAQTTASVTYTCAMAAAAAVPTDTSVAAAHAGK
jgi:hypothetical protein